jgi:hypothetical protein
MMKYADTLFKALIVSIVHWYLQESKGFCVPAWQNNAMVGRLEI